MRFFVLLIILGSGIACSRYRNIANDIEALTSKNIVLPTLYNINNDIIGKKPITLVVYYDSLECSHCRVAHLVDMNDVVEISDVDDQFGVLFIFTPSKKDVRQLWLSLNKHEYQEKICLDSLGVFIQENPHIPTSHQCHTLLLDRDNRVVLVGNPLASDTMWFLFRKTLDNMLANDGVYVSE